MNRKGNFISHKLREHLFVHYNISKAIFNINNMFLYFIMYCDRGRLQSINCDLVSGATIRCNWKRKNVIKAHAWMYSVLNTNLYHYHTKQKICNVTVFLHRHL